MPMRYLELIGIIVIGVVHVIIELTSSLVASRIYNACAAVAITAYLLFLAGRDKQVWRRWGFRCDNIWAALKVQSYFVGFGLVVMLIWQSLHGTRAVSGSFWIALAVYILWGTAQQFALQNLLAKNLRPLIPNAFTRALVASAVFSLSHVPRFELVGLAFVAGFFLTLAYHREENLWVSGFCHGLLGTTAFYALLNQDPGNRIMTTLERWWVNNQIP